MKKAIVIMILVASVVIIDGCSAGPGRYDEFAKCLTEKGITMYGTEWCPHCQNQKAAFESSFQYVDYVDCDKSKGVCAAKGIEGYPTWIINGEKHAGEQPLARLAGLSGCSIDANATA